MDSLCYLTVYPKLQMQKVINGVAIFSGLISTCLVAGGIFLYANKDNIIENTKAQIAAGVAESISQALPEIVDAAVPVVPTNTGPAIPTIR